MTGTTHSPDPFLAHHDASTEQHVVVAATPEATYDAIWSADLLATPVARALSRLAMCPERIAARLRRQPPPLAETRSAHLPDMLTERSPWILLADERGRGIVLGLLWTPPAGGAKCPPERFADFTRGGLAKVTWSITVEPFGPGHTLLRTQTHTQATDALAGRRFRMLWPLISPFAALLRRQVLRAIKDQAESARAGR